jgi:hypothetical protein
MGSDGIHAQRRHCRTAQPVAVLVSELRLIAAKLVESGN